MRFKRLQHVANTLTQMACGPLATADEELLRLGSGLLEVDVLLPSCEFAGSRLRRPPPTIWTLHQWLVGDLRQAGLPTAALQSCRLLIDLKVTKGELLGVACHCEVSTPDASYSSRGSRGAEAEPGAAPDTAG